jgi:thiol:disulfide interchange protein
VVILFASACSKAEPSKTAAPAPAATAKAAPALGWAELDPKQPLDKQIADQAAAAVAAGKKPFVYLHADWCEPCQAIKKTKTDPRMAKAFEGTHIIGLDIDSATAEQLAALKLDGRAIPVFHKVDGKGVVTGEKIDGGAWDDNIPENMAPPLTAFFAK